MSKLHVDTPISIVIPTKNAGPEFRKALEGIRNQARKSEVVVVDSGSTDGTVALAASFGAKTISIPPESFNHGATRNLGVREAKGQFCVMLVQDAVPVGEHWLENLISPFSDERVVGVTAQQVPRPDSNPVARWQVEYRIRFLGEEMRVQEVDSWDRFLALGPQERLRVASFDNVCSALRKEFWEACPFQPVPFAEDLDWGVRAIAAGRRLVYNPQASVIHSHDRPAAYHLRRSYISGRVVPKILHLSPVDIGIRTDKEFLERLGRVCGEAQAMLRESVTDWRQFSQSCGILPTLWRWSQAFAGVRDSRTIRTADGIRTDFYFVLGELLDADQSSAAKPKLSSIAAQALAEAAGSFAASYYNWCEAEGSVSTGMRRLNETLSGGV